MERKKISGEESIGEELLLDDIVIERVGEESSATTREREPLTEDEEIILEGEDLLPVDQSAEESLPGGRTPERDLPDLEALSAEVDGISAVDSAQEAITQEEGGVHADVGDTHERLEDLQIDDDFIIDLDAEALHTEKQDRSENHEKTAGVPAVNAVRSHKDLHGDLLDDEFIILEDESAASASALPSSMKMEAPREEVRADRRILEDQSAEASLMSASTESEIEEIIQDSGSRFEDSSAHATKAEDTSGLSITPPEDVAKSLSEEFDIHSLEPVDLQEAEKIANEDILILKEEDLIEELDVMDLIPLDEQTPAPVKAVAKAKTSPARIAPSDASIEKEADVPSDTSAVKVSAGEMHEPSADTQRLKSGSDAAMEIPEKLSHERSHNAAMNREPDEVIAEKPVEIEDVLEVADEVKRKHEQDIPAEEPILLEADEHELREVQPPPAARARAIEIIDEMADNVSLIGDSIPASHNDAGETAAVFEKDIVHEGRHGDTEDQYFDTVFPVEEAHEPVESRPLVREKIPDEFAVAGDRGSVRIIDDVAVEKAVTESESIFADGELEKSAIGLVDIVEGGARFIREASAEEDQEQMAAIMSGTAMAFEDLLVDFSEEYKFKDEDVDFIDHVFLTESAALAGGFGDEEKKRKKSRLTPSIEIFGLSDREVFEIETSIFTGEYKEIDLAKVKGALPAGLDQAPSDFSLMKNCRYLGASSSEIGPMEKKSIEDDVVADEALVFEESVEDIRRVLLNYRKMKKQHPDDVMDISDEIVIIDDKSDIERFADTFESEKRENIKKLLQYLDGLFEKLPEDVVRKFAESEYYNLYVTIMKELER